MRRFSLLMLLLMTLGSCAPSPKPEEPHKPTGLLPDLPVPYDLEADVGDSAVQLNWELRGKRNRYTLGYGVFVSSTSLKGVPADQLPAPFINWPPYQLDQDPNSWTSYNLNRLENGKRYFVHIRLRGSNDRVSEPSNEVVVIPRPEGQFTLHETSSRQFSAFDFSEQKLLSSTNAQADLVFDVRSGVALFRSPHLRKAGNRETGIVSLKNLYDFELLTTLENPVLNEEAVVGVGHVYLLQTEENRYAKLIVDAVGGDSPDQFVKVRFAYQLIPNLIHF